jgi:hypothetical protein
VDRIDPLYQYAQDPIPTEITLCTPHYDRRYYLGGFFPVPYRLEDRIRALVARAVASDDPAELDELIWQLRNVLHEHAKQLRQLAADKLVPSTR